ncbi:hypothetical protein JJB09_03220 [Rhizobium sp. KVB221]|uniref:Peptidase M10 serralysin C-terminal domain-containing protein n=1 Tax=Rhizobium setariae TaxID=2801340 RepID=A0A936YMU0_9HYPH|nr:calcium-binding protein [Rhizobium setariae]MBL0371029.1 hypothetical protein [Rhizobium setariae]
MAIFIRSGNTEFDIEESGETYILGTSFTRIVTNANGIFIGDGFTDNTLIVRGEILQSGNGFAAIWADGTDTTIRIAATGSIKGFIGIASANTEPSSDLDIFNDGTIEGSNFAIQTQDSTETVINHGEILGRIDLGSGKDLFDNRGGKVDHRIGGGTGDDTLIVDRAATKLFENGGSAGYDTVRSTVTYTLSANVERLVLLGSRDIDGNGTADGDDLFGNGGDNVLRGKAGVDDVSGKKGNDILFGGFDSDTFHFSTGDGRDVIADFTDGSDRIDVSHWNAIAGFNDLINNHAHQQGNDVLIEAGSDSLLIKNIAKTDLDAMDFIFI